MINYNQYVYKKFDNFHAVKKWSTQGLYDVLSNMGSWKYNDKLYRMKYVLDAIPRARAERSKALDLGCAAGAFIPYLIGKGYEVTGVDIAQGMVDEAKVYCKTLNLSADFSVMDSNKLDLPSNHFDVCIAVGLIEHQQNDNPTISEIYRVLKPGGICIITVRNYFCPYIRWQGAFESTIRLMRNLWRFLRGRDPDYPKTSHGREHRLFRFLKILKKDGFQPINFRFSHFYIFPYPLSVYLKKINYFLSKPLERFNSSKILGWLGSTIIICAVKSQK